MTGASIRQTILDAHLPCTGLPHAAGLDRDDRSNGVTVAPVERLDCADVGEPGASASIYANARDRDRARSELNVLRCAETTAALHVLEVGPAIILGSDARGNEDAPLTATLAEAFDVEPSTLRCDDAGPAGATVRDCSYWFSNGSTTVDASADTVTCSERGDTKTVDLDVLHCTDGSTLVTTTSMGWGIIGRDWHHLEGDTTTSTRSRIRERCQADS